MFRSNKLKYNCHVVNVKWGKEAYSVDCSTTEEPLIFKSQMYALTNVPV